MLQIGRRGLLTSKWSAGVRQSVLRPQSVLFNHVKRTLFREFHVSIPKKAPFWQVGTNIRVFRNMLKENGNSQWRYRLVVCVVAFTVLNFIFNLMLTILTDWYLQTIQPSTWKFGFGTNSEFKTGIVNEVVKFQEEKANENYYTCIKSLAKENKLISDPDSVLDVQEVILSKDQLDKWFYEKKNLEYISIYCDLLFRYALTLDESKYEDVIFVITKAFDLVNHYEDLSHEHISSYTLKNKALRIQAEMMKFNNVPFTEIEGKLYESVKLVIENEYKTPHPESDDIAIVPAGEISSNNLTNTLLELASFYSESRDKVYLNKALSILLADLRALDAEFNQLDKVYDSNDLYAKKSTLSHSGEKRLMELKFERIPLLNMQISELLWTQNYKQKAIEMAKESAQVSSMYASMNYNSAKIAKMGFLNLSTMFHQTGDDEASGLCMQRSKEIEVPMSAFLSTPTRIRDVVLDHYFGMWGRFFFPG